MTEPIWRQTTRGTAGVGGSYIAPPIWPDVPPNTPVVVLTEDDYKTLARADEERADWERWCGAAEKGAAALQTSHEQWVKDHPAEAAQALIDAGHLEADGVVSVLGDWEWDPDKHPPEWEGQTTWFEDETHPDEAQPLYRLVLPTEETPDD